MALKDWELRRNRNGNLILYRNKRFRSVTLSIGTYNKNQDSKLSGKSFVEVDDPANPKKFMQVNKLFKTKPQALKYAKAYMQQH